MSGKIISIANMKGGVGKTTLAVCLALSYAKKIHGHAAPRVLLVDLDAQANASFWLCGDSVLTELIEGGKTIDAFLEDTLLFSMKRPLLDFLHDVWEEGPNGRRLSVIPSSPELRLVERELIYFLSEGKRSLREIEAELGERFAHELDALRCRFDIILFDTAPGISALTEAALRASDMILVPTIPDFISNLGLEAFCRSVWKNNREGARSRLPHVVANMVKETSHHAIMLSEMRSEAGATDAGFCMLDTQIPNSLAIEESGGLAGISQDRTELQLDETAKAQFQALADEIWMMLEAVEQEPAHVRRAAG